MTDDQNELQALRLQVNAVAAQQQAMRLALHACIVSSPDAIAVMQRARPKYVECLRRFGITDPVQIQCGTDFLEGLTRAGELHRPGSLPEFAKRAIFGMLTTLESAVRPSQWTTQGGLLAAIVAIAACALAV